MAHIPKQVPRIAGNLNDGQSYERRLLLFIAAALSQNEEVDNFWIVSNPTGVDKIDDVVLRISFKDSSKNDIALFVQAKLSRSDDKVLWLNLEPKKTKQKTSQKFEIKLTEYEKAFNDVVRMMNDANDKRETEELRKLLKGVDVKDYFVCIFTNMSNSDPQLKCKQFAKGDPIYFLDIREYGQCQQFDYESEKFDSDFYKQFYVFLGQPNFKGIDYPIAKALGKDYINKLENLDRIIKEFMQNDDFCNVLTKQKFEEQWLKVLLDEWMRVDVEQVDEINPEFITLWHMMFSGKQIINLRNDQTWPLLACYYQCVLKEIDNNLNWHNQSVLELKELLFSLWCVEKIPLPIKSDCTRNVLKFLDNFKTVHRRFVVFSSKDSPELISDVGQISDVRTMAEIMKVQVSLQGRPPVVLSDIAQGVSMQSEQTIRTAVKGIYRQLKISQLLKWTKNAHGENRHVIGPILRKPDDNYLARNFKMIQDKEENVLTVDDVLKLTKPGMLIITGDPGTGKSTVLQELAHKYSSKNFVIYVILRDCLYDIENDDICQSIEADPLQYFFEKITKNTDQFEDTNTTSIFNIHKTSKRLCLFLDGYDEILPLHGSKVFSIMVKILENTAIPIFCTSRPHAKEQITSRPETICLELSPLTSEQINQYLKHHKMEPADIRDHFAENFLSNPLHLSMISQIYKEPGEHKHTTRGKMFKTFIEVKHRTLNDKIGLPQNYAHRGTQSSMKNHRKLAMMDIFGRVCVTSKGLLLDFEFDDVLEDTAEHNIGIVDVRKSNSTFQFRHRTFAEYLVADWLIQKANLDNSNKNHYKYYYKQIVSNPVYRDIYGMLNELSRNFTIWLKAIKSSQINSDIFILDEFGRNVAHVQYWYLKSLNPVDNPYNFEWMNTVYKSRLYYRKDAVLGWTCQEFRNGNPNVNRSVAVNEINEEYPNRKPLTGNGNNYIKLLIAIDAEDKEEMKSVLESEEFLLDTGVGIIAFHSAITTGNESIVKLLLDLRPNLLDEEDGNRNTALHIASAFGYRDIVALLLEKRATLDKKNVQTFVPLQMAAAEGQLEIFLLLVDRLSDIRVVGHPSAKECYDKLLWNTLTTACRRGQVKIVIYLLENGADPALSDDDGWTAIHHAAEEGQSQILKLLFDRNLNVNEKTTTGGTPLTFASRNKHWQTVKLLLDHGANPVHSNEDGYTSMHFAALEGQLKILELLLEMRANVNVKTAQGLTPLTCACRKEHWDAVKWLLEHGADPTLSNNDGRTAMHYAAESNQLEIIMILLTKGLSVNAKTNTGVTPLITVSKNKRWDTCKWLLERGADPKLSKNDGWTVMHYAAMDGQIDILELSLQLGLNINARTKKGDTPLIIASKKTKWDAIKWLLEHNADPTLPNNDGWTVMHYAANDGAVDIIKILFEMGLHVNAKTDIGDTSLTIASNSKRWDTVRWLLEHDADPTLSKRDGWTAIHFAAKEEPFQIIKLLLEKGANVNAKTNSGETSLIIASAFAKWGTVRLLLENNADPTLSKSDGWTIMHFAAKKGPCDILVLLLERRLDINAKTNRGETPLTLATQSDNWDAVKWLLAHNAETSEIMHNRWTLMHFAANRGQLEILKLLFQKGHNVNARNNSGETPLTLAIRHEHSDTVNWLLSHGTNN